MTGDMHLHQHLWIFLLAVTVSISGCSPSQTIDTVTPEPTPAPVRETSSQPVASTVAADSEDFLFESAENEPAPTLLSEFGAFQDLARQVPAAGVIPFALNVEHFADYARVSRFLRVPRGAQIRYSTDGVLEFPVGTVLLQTFRLPSEQSETAASEQLIETRVMRKLQNGWDAVAYQWNKDGTDARRALAGGIVPLSAVGGVVEGLSHRYIILNANDCKRCHENQGVMLAIGPTIANLNRDFPYEDGNANQIEYWTRRGILTEAPASLSEAPRLVRWDDPKDGTVEQRARTWLHVNCAHCHNPIGAGGVSGLDLRLTQQNPIQLGIYKPPVAAGRGSEGNLYSIEPGHPQSSFLVGRLTSTGPAVMMPPVGRRLPNAEAIALVSQWISGMRFSETESQNIITKQRERFEVLKREGKWQQQTE
ncbi:MAG: hypothetical protein IT366_03345 [Candidatus Hydrogenedentes bacterium]|nr:hypothetical protein [Candidatus Hydrogenedentota bacterium]